MYINIVPMKSVIHHLGVSDLIKTKLDLYQIQPPPHRFYRIADCLLEHVHVEYIAESCFILRCISLIFEICTLCEVFEID